MSIMACLPHSRCNLIGCNDTLQTGKLTIRHQKMVVELGADGDDNSAMTGQRILAIIFVLKFAILIKMLV